MAFRMNLWRVDGEELRELPNSPLDAEERLESWLAKDPSLLGADLLIIGRQVTTTHGTRVDLLGLDREANCVVVELKRDRTPREVVAQLLDYGSWIQHLGYEELDSICTRFRNASLTEAFTEAFGGSLPETVNAEHSLFLVASELDDSSERIIEYLGDSYDIPINAVFFTCFATPEGEYVGRAWLQDPEDVTERAAAKKRSPWSGLWFVNVGEGPHRNWDDNIRYSFIGAGQGIKYSKPLQKLTPGSKVVAYMKGRGYVGYGEVIGRATPITDYIPEGQNNNLLELPLEAPNASDNAGDPKMCEWVVPIRWHKTYRRDEARTYPGIFANQNIVCKLQDSQTIAFLRREFGIEDAG